MLSLLIIKFYDFAALINTNNLSNALAVSILISDANGDYLLTQRSANVGIGESLYSVTVTGAVDENDYFTEDVTINCAMRELKEELNIDVPKTELHLEAIVAGKNKCGTADHEGGKPGHELFFSITEKE